MKKYLILLLVSIFAVSCFKSSYSESSMIEANFEFGPNAMGKDSTYFSPDGAGVVWSHLAFCYAVDSQTSKFSGGFMVSRYMGMLGKDTEGMDLTWRVHAPKMNNTYLVYQRGDIMPKTDVQFLSSTYGTCALKLCFVANTAKVAKEVESLFERGDKLTLKAKGFLADQETGSAEIDLADFTMVDKAGQPKDSIVSTWTKFDLTPLGSVDKVKFELESTKPAVTRAFCMDSFVANVSIEY